ncbi:DUF5684 domain-containing protein [Clostridium sp. Ade.TY]|uniref:DUF5684 domain-containing protein n=1 Tax=Clostridium sp. Ade.TY TaxID=1391647 RepID=UPI0004289655|nr:DUF5684 domain-containing protein [Clostridium sp. Ade.TY]
MYTTIYDTLYATGSITFGIIVYAVIYLIEVYPLYVMAKKADLNNPWVMFIPVFNMFKLYHLAGLSYWYILLTLIPFIGWIIPIIVLYKVFRNFDVGIFGSILGVIFSFIGFWYLALSSKQFIGEIPDRFKAF